MLYRYRADIPWRDLHERFGDFRVAHLRHMRWSKSGGWQGVFEALAQDADNEYATIDATSGGALLAVGHHAPFTHPHSICTQTTATLRRVFLRSLPQPTTILEQSTRLHVSRSIL